MHAEILLMGELQSRYKDKLAELPFLKARDEEIETLRSTYRDEIMSTFNIQSTLFMYYKIYNFLFKVCNNH